MKVIFHPEARQEFLDSIVYYEGRVASLGVDFRRAVLAVIQNAIRYPGLWPDVGRGIRKGLVHRFPYAVLYEATPSGLCIYAVMNLHRHPDYWKNRM